jgi:hypothetical protein
MRNLINIISEAALTKADIKKHDGKYVQNIVSLVKAGAPLEVAPSAQKKFGKTVIADPDMIDKWVDAINNPLTSNSPIHLKNPSGSEYGGRDLIYINEILKTAAIKGKGADYNIGDIGEIALGVAAATRFLKLGEQIDPHDFVRLGAKLDMSNITDSKGKTLDSIKLEITDKIQHASGKHDVMELKILAPGRSIKTFMNVMQNPEAAPVNIQGAILSAIRYANESAKVEVGIQKTSLDPNVNTISIVSDGVSNQKGTKVDLIMTIDGQNINLISAKAGPSQLGQATGHEWTKQVQFFNTVFGVDIDAYSKYWGTTHQEHLEALKKVYEGAIIPKVSQLVGGNNTEKEMVLIRQITNGLIRYSNNIHPTTGEVEVIDIVKLITDPNSAGYKLIRVDSRLEAALAKVNLIGAANKNRQGVEVYGNIKGKNILLFKARSYYSPAGKTTRTIIEGGSLLDQLAEMTPPAQPAPPPAAPAPVTAQPAASTQPAAAQPPATTTTPTPPVSEGRQKRSTNISGGRERR